jgi:hypothetical protein
VSKLNIDYLQLGTSSTASQNFVIKTNKDGSGGLYRGNQGAESASILTWDANGRLAEAGVVAFSAYQSTAQAMPSGGPTLLTNMVEEFDIGNCYTPATNRFTAPVDGLYQINGAYEQVGITLCGCYLYKNGSTIKRGWDSSNVQTQISSVIQLAAGDYIDLRGYSGTAQNSVASISQTFFNGYLVTRL